MKYGVPNLKSFVGAQFISIHIDEPIYEEGEATLKITISTNIGPLILTFWNSHNGYYPHDVYVQAESFMKYYHI